MVIALCEFRSKHKKWPSFRIPELGNNFQMNGIVEKSPLEGLVHIVQGSRWKEREKNSSTLSVSHLFCFERS